MSDKWNISCSWYSDDKCKSIRDCLTVTSITTSAVDVEEVVCVDNCIQLIAPEVQNARDFPCRLSFELRTEDDGEPARGTSNIDEQKGDQRPASTGRGPLSEIAKVSVLSEARNVEIFVEDGEYVTTVRCEKIEDVGEIAMYRGECELPAKGIKAGVARLSLRLVPSAPETKTSLWLFALLVETRPSRAPRGPDAAATLGPLPVNAQLLASLAGLLRGPLPRGPPRVPSEAVVAAIAVDGEQQQKKCVGRSEGRETSRAPEDLEEELEEAVKSKSDAGALNSRRQDSRAESDAADRPNCGAMVISGGDADSGQTFVCSSCASRDESRRQDGLLLKEYLDGRFNKLETLFAGLSARLDNLERKIGE